MSEPSEFSKPRRKEDRKRWPVTNTDELTRHIARQLPELTRRQVIAVLQLATSSILKSLEDQALAGYEQPSVTLRRFGRIELRRVRSMKRRVLGGAVREIRAHWKLVLVTPRPRRDQVKRWAIDETRRKAEERPVATQPERRVDESSQTGEVLRLSDLPSTRAPGDHAGGTAGGGGDTET